MTSNLRTKCIYYNADSVFAKNKCFIIDQLYSRNPNASQCNHLHGFNGKMAKNDAEVLKYLKLRNYIKSGETLTTSETKGESYTTEARVLCEYSDIFSCENGYRLHGIHCYKVIRKERYWAEALRTCQQQDSTLAVPHNDRDTQFIASVVSKENILNDNDNSFFWVGMFVKDHKHLKFVDQTTPDYFRWLPIGHKRFMTKAYNTPNTVIAVGSSASNKGNVGQFGYYQVINGNFHRLPFLCQKLAGGEYGPIYYPKRD